MRWGCWGRKSFCLFHINLYHNQSAAKFVLLSNMFYHLFQMIDWQVPSCFVGHQLCRIKILVSTILLSLAQARPFHAAISYANRVQTVQILSNNALILSTTIRMIPQLLDFWLKTFFISCQAIQMYLTNLLRLQ